MNKPKKLPDRAYLLANFKYDPLTGKLTKDGKEIGWLDNNGYRKMSFKAKTGRRLQYYVHRIVYYMYYGRDPGMKAVDHCDGDPANNCISNLRLVSHKVNLMNTARQRTLDGRPPVPMEDAPL